MKSTKQRVCEFIKAYQNAAFEVRPDHYLSQDLLIHGTQGLYFILDFGREFDVDFSQMEITKYFSCENFFSSAANFIRRILGRRKRIRVPVIDLLVSELIQAAEAKKWSDEFVLFRPNGLSEQELKE